MASVESPVDKQLVDIDLGGGIDESKPEESIDWTKSFSNIENLVPLTGSYTTRPGLGLMGAVDDSSTVLSPIHRLVNLEETVGAICQKYKLVQWSDNTQSWFNKGKLSEFGVAAIKAGTAAASTTYSGVAGVGVTTNYLAIAYVGESNDTTSPVTWLHLDIMDKNGYVILKSYRYEATGLFQFGMVCVDDRYLHIFQSGSSIVPRMFVIDTSNLPAGPTLSPVFTNATSGGSGNYWAGICAVSGFSVGVFTNTRYASANSYIEKFNNSAVGSNSTYIGGTFTTVSGLATDGTNFYISGFGANFNDPTASLTETGYWSDYGGGNWVGTTGGTLTNVGCVTGTAQNGFNPCQFGTGADSMQAPSNMSVYCSANSGTVLMCIKPLAYDVVATPGIPFGIVLSPASAGAWIRLCRPYGFYFNNGAIDGSVPYLPAVTGRYHFLAYKWDGTHGWIKLNRGDWIKSTSLRPSTQNYASNMQMTCQGSNQWDLLACLVDDATMSDRDIEDVMTYWENRYDLEF